MHLELIFRNSEKENKMLVELRNYFYALIDIPNIYFRVVFLELTW